MPRFRFSVENRFFFAKSLEREIEAFLWIWSESSISRFIERLTPKIMKHAKILILLTLAATAFSAVPASAFPWENERKLPLSSN